MRGGGQRGRAAGPAWAKRTCAARRPGSGGAAGAPAVPLQTCKSTEKLDLSCASHSVKRLGCRQAWSRCLNSSGGRGPGPQPGAMARLPCLPPGDRGDGSGRQPQAEEQGASMRMQYCSGPGNPILQCSLLVIHVSACSCDWKWGALRPTTPRSRDSRLGSAPQSALPSHKRPAAGDLTQ